ncbi:MAG: hypothetical protein DRJ65_15655 [Acidobacteria bacterium]|nr:MAG: hypothetical protein DRJ65_15655 [Acidobacteriota bacterium]
MGLLKRLQPVRWSGNPKARRNAARRCTGEEELVRFSCEDPDLEVRLLAVERLQSTGSMRRVAVEGKYLDVRLKAARAIKEPAVLAGIMCERKQPDLMMVCFEGIRDQEVLAGIAGNPGQSLTARRIAINMFADQAQLAELLSSLREPALREAALDRIEDPDLKERLRLEEEAACGPGPEERALELAKRTDPDELAEVFGAFRGSPGAVRGLGALASMAGGGSTRAVEILRRQLKNARADIRLLALERLAAAGEGPGDLLADMVEEDPDPGVRRFAASLAASETDG